VTVPRLRPEADSLFGPVSPAAALPAAAGLSPSGRGRVLEHADEEARPGGDLVIVVYGIPGPQGSKTVKGARRTKTGKLIANLVESSAKVKPWREDVVQAAVTAVAKAHFGCLANRWPMFDGPVAVGMTFTLPALKRRPKDRLSPSVKPDLSKLIRSTEDALTDANVWTDDSLVVEYRYAAKTYPGEHRDALDAPGAVIRVWSLDGAE
jgi:Holliday junction resolvase RusA-like endonuclease